MGSSGSLWYEKTIKLKTIIIFLLLIINWPIAILANSHVRQITLSELEAVQVAGNLIAIGKYDSALKILTQLPQTGQTSIEIERWYLIAQIEQRKGNIDKAIKIYRKILDQKPDLEKIRYELALCYMYKKQWYRADYHLRLALAGKDIPNEIKKRMLYYRYVARQNKKWNIWFNFGAAPDNNINQATGGEERIITQWGTFYRQLPDPVTAVGYNLTLGGNYEIKLNNNWYLKNEANIYTNIYDKHDYDDLFLSASTGPRYVWKNGDVWFASIYSYRWYGWKDYNKQYGGKLNLNYDFTRKMSANFLLKITDNIYDEYGNWMDGQTYLTNIRTIYYLDTTKYIVLSGGIERTTANNDIYATWRYSTAVGFGFQLLWGFSVYLEPSFSWLNYDGNRWTVKNNTYTELAEQDFTQHYSISLSNSKIDIYGFSPTITFGYTKRDSNISNRKYEKQIVEFTMHQRF